MMAAEPPRTVTRKHSPPPKPDPDLPDPKRLDRLRAKAGELIRFAIRSFRVEDHIAATDRVLRSMPGTADQRERITVPADDAGQAYEVVVSRCIVEQLRNTRDAAGTPLLSWRQGEALMTLRRLRRASGLRQAWERPAGHGGERPERAEIEAGEELVRLLCAVPVAIRAPLLHMLATDEWAYSLRVSQVQDAADAVADRLKLARDA
jgi:hypothetical protein